MCAALLLAACGSGGDANESADDAARIEQGHRADVRLEEPLPDPAAARAPVAPPAAKVATPEPSDDQARAAGVARRYFDLIAKRDYPAAYRLWEDAGNATGMTAREFAASFDRYAEYRAELGTPGRVDAGAGQRYVEIPVTATGRLDDGDRPFRMKGTLVLHRTADIDGATAEDRSWRIRDSTLRPRPVAVESEEPVRQPNRVRALYRCEDGSRYGANFDNDAGTVELVTGRRRLATLEQQPSGSGIAYAGEGHELRGKGAEADLTFPDGEEKHCTADP